MAEDLIDLGKFSRRDVGRLLGVVNERKKKLDRGIAKFGDDFDEELGANMLQSRDAYRSLQKRLKDKLGEE